MIDVQKILSEIARDIEKIFQSFQKISVAVFGDVMLDEYLIGDSTRISPEAPVPVVRIESSYSVSGGAANTSVNIRKLGGCRVKVFSVVGDDEVANKIEEDLRRIGIETLLIREKGRKTPRKVRVIARGQQVIRIDDETTERVHQSSVSRILENFFSDRFDVVVFSDYAKGNVTPHFGEVISGTKSICDPKPKNIKIFQGAYMILPNEREANEIFQMLFADYEGIMAPYRIMEKLGLKKLVITRGERGMSFFSQERSFDVPALAKEVYDVTGAGDTVSAVFGLCEGIGLEDEKSVVLSSVAASIKVSHRGTYAPTKLEVIRTLKQIIEQNKT